MTESTEIAFVLEKQETNKKMYDEECKKILSNKQILAHILKGCVEEFKDIEIEEIPKYIEYVEGVKKADTGKIRGLNTDDTRVNEALIKYDVLFEVALPDATGKIGLIINIEAQNKDNPGYNLVSRAIYYESRLLARQKNEDGGFTNSNYDDLKKVYSIWICMRPNKKKEDSITMYSIQETCIQNEVKCPKEIYDLMTIVMLYPKEEYDYNDEQFSMLEMLSLLLTSRKDAKTKLSKLENDYGILMTKEIETEVDTMRNLAQGFYDDGVKEGVEKGIVKGANEKELEMIQKLAESRNITPAEAMDWLQIEESKRPQYAEAVALAQTVNAK